MCRLHHCELHPQLRKLPSLPREPVLWSAVAFGLALLLLLPPAPAFLRDLLLLDLLEQPCLAPLYSLDPLDFAVLLPCAPLLLIPPRQLHKTRHSRTQPNISLCAQTSIVIDANAGHRA